MAYCSIQNLIPLIAGLRTTLAGDTSEQSLQAALDNHSLIIANLLTTKQLMLSANSQENAAQYKVLEATNALLTIQDVLSRRSAESDPDYRIIAKRQESLLKLPFSLLENGYLKFLFRPENPLAYPIPVDLPSDGTKLFASAEIVSTYTPGWQASPGMEPSLESVNLWLQWWAVITYLAGARLGYPVRSLNTSQANCYGQIICEFTAFLVLQSLQYTVGRLEEAAIARLESALSLYGQLESGQFRTIFLGLI